MTFSVNKAYTQILTADAGLDEGVAYTLAGKVARKLAPGISGGTLIGASYNANL